MDCENSGCSFIIQYWCVYAGFFFCMRLSIVFSRSIKNCGGTLMGFVLNLYITFINMAIFTMFNPTDSWALEIFPSYDIFLNFFLQRVEVLVIQILHFLVRVTPRYFVLFEAIALGVDSDSLIAFSTYLYMRATGIWVNIVSNHLTKGVYQL